MKSELDKAILIATKVHSGQTRANGLPYILHPMRVMLKVRALTRLIKPLVAAVLHDVVEDSDITFKDLKESGISPEVITALKLLTHFSYDSYVEYIHKIVNSNNQSAIMVKIADLEDNMNLEEIPNIKDYHIKRHRKYRRARNELLELRRKNNG